jgi:glycosyltransferase involved in cell wall biosynthesis
MQRPVFLNGRFLGQPVTGVQRFSVEIARAIDRLAGGQEWPEATILTPRRTAPRAATPPFQHLRVRPVGKTRGHAWEQTELSAATRGGILVGLGNTAPVLAGRRQVVVIHDAGIFDTPESYSALFRSWYRLLQRGLVSTGAHIVTVSEFSRGRIAARLGLDPADIPVIYEGADHILRVPPDPATLQRHGLHRGRFALVVGSGAAHKNLEGLHEAAATLQRRGMTIAVAGSLNPDVFSNRPANDLAQRRLGRVSDAELRALYENAACLLFPSRYEGFGLPPVEAMACRCPVLAARGGAVEEVCRDAALYFTHEDGRAASEAVERLLDEAALADTLRERGTLRAEALSWEASARLLGQVVQRLR